MYQQRAGLSGKAKAKSTKPDPAAPAKAARTWGVPSWARLPSFLPELDREAVEARKQAVNEASTSSNGGSSAALTAVSMWGTSHRSPLKPARRSPEALLRYDEAKARYSKRSFAELHSALRQLLTKEHVEPGQLGLLAEKAGDAEQLGQVLDLMALNHLAQALQPKSHGPCHAAIYPLLLQEASRLGATAVLVRLWDSVHEYGVALDPKGIVDAAVLAEAKGDGDAVLKLHGLALLYWPAAPAELTAAAARAHERAGNAEASAALRQEATAAVGKGG